MWTIKLHDSHRNVRVDFRKASADASVMKTIRQMTELFPAFPIKLLIAYDDTVLVNKEIHSAEEIPASMVTE